MLYISHLNGIDLKAETENFYYYICTYYFELDVNLYITLYFLLIGLKKIHWQSSEALKEIWISLRYHTY